MSRRRPTLPLWGWAVGATLSVSVVTGGLLAIGLALAGRWDARAAALSISLAAAGCAVATVCAALIGDRISAALHSLRDEAVRTLSGQQADAGEHRPVRGIRATAEMGELRSALDAIALRMRITEELATRHRRSAETASAGMFEMLSGLVSAEEGARGQLAAELHDTVAQSLVAARTLLEDGQGERALAYLEDAEDQTRATMARTRPPALRDGDLAAAVSGLCEELHQRYALDVALSWPDEARPLPIATAVTVYRFVQEALLNVVKHSDVDAAAVALAFEGEALVVSVCDGGAGFEPTQVRSERGRHVGLGLLRERVRLAGGTLEVSSAPGRGTRLTMWLPAGAARPADIGEQVPARPAGRAGPGPAAQAGVQRSAETPGMNGGMPAMAAMVAMNASRWGARSRASAADPID